MRRLRNDDPKWNAARAPKQGSRAALDLLSGCHRFALHGRRARALWRVSAVSKNKIPGNGRSLAGTAIETIVANGIALVLEGRRIFGRMSVRENLVVASGLRGGPGRIGATLDRVLELFPILRQRYQSPAGFLSGGEQQQLAIARAVDRAASVGRRRAFARARSKICRPRLRNVRSHPFRRRHLAERPSRAQIRGPHMLCAVGKDSPRGPGIGARGAR